MSWPLLKQIGEKSGRGVGGELCPPRELARSKAARGSLRSGAESMCQAGTLQALAEFVSLMSSLAQGSGSVGAAARPCHPGHCLALGMGFMKPLLRR